MKKNDFTTLINRSIERTLFVLFRPFSLKKWLCFLFIAWLAGAFGGGANMGFDFEDLGKFKKSSQQHRQEEQRHRDITEQEGELARDLANVNAGYRQNEDLAGDPDIKGRFKIPSPVVILASLVLLVFLLALMLTVLWFSSRFKFIWFNAVVKNDGSISDPFKLYRKEGNSLFLFFVVWSFVSLIALAAMVIWIYFTGVGRGMFSQDAGFSLGSAVGALALPLLIALPLILAGIVLMIIVDQLVVPIMAMERCGFKEAWGKSSAVLRANSKDCWLYLCLYFALSIICGIILIFAVFLAVFALLLVAGIIAGLLYALVVGLFKFSALFYFLAVIIGVPFILIVFLILFALNLPFALFLKSFSLYFLSSLDCRYEPLPLEGPSQDEA